METANIQLQIDDINRKLDVLLDYVNQQRLKTEALEDLTADVSRIGKSVYDYAVEELETRQVELDPDEMKMLMINFIKNIKNFNNAIKIFESVVDFTSDAAPIAKEIIIDFTEKLHEFEQKGYFELIRKVSDAFDKTVVQFSKNDIPEPSLWKIMKDMNSPEVRRTMGLMLSFVKNVSHK